MSRRIVQGVPTLTTNFWEVVARRLGTGHTPQQCSTAYHEQSGRMKPLSARPKKKEKSQEMSITAKSGTLKRKRQLRDALEHFDSGYYDDIFDSTPFKKIKKSVQVHVHIGLGIYPPLSLCLSIHVHGTFCSI